MRYYFLCCLLVLSLLLGSGFAQEPVQPEHTFAINKRDSVTARSYMIATANPLASALGNRLLAQGASAADVAVAVQLMLNLVEPQSSGLGGGAFALYWDASEQRLSSWDGREKAPMNATQNYWLDANGAPVGFFDAVVGGRSVGVPGTLKLIEHLHQNFGILPWVDLVLPTIRQAEQGFHVSPRLANAIARAKERGLWHFPKTRKYFSTEDGAPLPAGHLLQNWPFAKMLRLIARDGSKPFYHGNIAAQIVSIVQTPENPGILTKEDFANYEVIERPVICAPYHAYQVCGMGPPSSGGLTVGQILMLLEGFDLGAMGPGADAYHLFAEASKLAFADRSLYMADSDFVKMPTTGLLDPDYLAMRARLISPKTAMSNAEPGSPPWDKAGVWAPDLQKEQPGTSHFVIVDSHGDMLSMTSTIETGFGSRLMSNGFLLNNELTDFSRTPRKDGRLIANRVEGAKRPRSSMAPTIVLRAGQPVLLTGSPGGSRIIGYVAQSIIAMLDWQMDPQQALDLGHVINRNGSTELEEGSDAITYGPALTARGHDIKHADHNSGLQAIVIKDGVLTGATDKRREGLVLGQ